MVKTKILNVDSTLASAWLEHHNKNNRNILDHVVDKYSRDMSSNRWAFTGDPIQFDTEGNLINGQHRLSAVVKSNKPQKFLIVEGLEPEAQDAIDSNAVRKAGQQLAMHGVKNGQQVAAIVRLLLKWEAGSINMKTIASTAEIRDFTMANQERLELSVYWYYAIGRSLPISRAAIGAFVFKLLELAERYPDFTTTEHVINFLEKLESGAGLDHDDPILVLRNMVLRTRAAKLYRGAVRDLYSLVRTWNAYASGERYSKLQGPKDGIVTMNHLLMRNIRE